MLKVWPPALAQLPNVSKLQSLLDSPLTGSCSVQEQRDCSNGQCIREFDLLLHLCRYLIRTNMLRSDGHCELHDASGGDQSSEGADLGGVALSR